MRKLPNSEPDGHVRAVSRALSIIDVLAAERRSLSVSDVARLTGLTQSTAHRLLATIVEFGWAEHNQHTSRYRLAAGILGPASVALAHAPLLVQSKPAMAELTARFGYSCYIGVLVGPRVAFLDRSDGQFGTGFHPGISQPAHCTSSGKVLLAALDVASYGYQIALTKTLAKYTPNTITDAAELRTSLDRVSVQGLAIDDREFREDWCSVAVPIRDMSGKVIAAMSYGGPSYTITVEQLRTIAVTMIDMADQISLALGLGED